MPPIYGYITLDRHKYAVLSGAYSRKWTRMSSFYSVANIVRVNFVDRGPGYQTYDMTLLLASWDAGSKMNAAGITETFDQQRQNLETTYNKTSTLLRFYDVFGETPKIFSPGVDAGVFFNNYTQIVPQYATSQKGYILAEVQLIAQTSDIIII